MQNMAPEVVSIADACLGGLQGRSALLIGPEQQRYPFIKLLQRARMKHIYQEETPQDVSHIIPFIQLLISMPTTLTTSNSENVVPILTAANVAKGCSGRHTPLLIFDLSTSTSVEELAGLLPAVCLYTHDDVQRILAKTEANIY